jgi:type II secretory pathway component PulK
MRRDGFVLVAALWLIVALGAVGLDAAVRSQSQRLAAANQLDNARAREAALAGSEYARSRLTAALLERADELRAEAARAGRSSVQTQRAVMAALSRDDPWHDPAGLVAPALELGDAAFQLDVQDTGLRLNINTATEEMLHNFLGQGLRIDFAWADRLTQAILDWRDGDDLPRVNGAERDEYLAAGAAVLPANAPFGSIDELRHVLGMTPELFAAIRPLVTVRGSGRINVNAAPEAVLLAVPTFTPAVAAELLRRRSAGQLPRSSAELRAILGLRYRAPTGTELANFNRRVTYATNEVEIVAAGAVSGSPVSATVASIVARSDAAALLVWRRME